MQDTEMWSPEQELRLLEELAEAEAQAFEMELDVAIRSVPAEPERPWIAYWRLSPGSIESKARPAQRMLRSR